MVPIPMTRMLCWGWAKNGMDVARFNFLMVIMQSIWDVWKS